MYNLSRYWRKSKNQKWGRGNLNETENEYLKNGSNNFLRTRCINTILHIFQNVLVVYKKEFRKFRKAKIWKPNFSFRKFMSRTNNLNVFLKPFNSSLLMYNRKNNGSPNLVWQFSEMVLSIKNGSNNFL